MPYKAKRPCSWPGCPNLTDDRYCSYHQSLYYKQYNNMTRTPEQKARYGRSWQRKRNKYIEEHPFCERCLSEGRLIPADTVHHKIPVSEGGSDNFENLMSLCKACHNQIHDRFSNKKREVYAYRSVGEGGSKSL